MPIAPVFKRGLVVGKFSPLHRGHQYLIETAAVQCEQLVVISYSNPELPGCEAPKRSAWFAALYPKVKALVLDLQHPEMLRCLPEGLKAVPLNDADERLHREFTGALCTHLLGCPVDAVFTSESYGDGLAEELTRWFSQYDQRAPAVIHQLVDRQRHHVPVSGTWVRQDIHARRQWLSPNVYASFVRRVCLLGGESSGKSTLAQALAKNFDTTFVWEYGRELWEERNGELVYEDMLMIAREQLVREEKASRQAFQYLFCDTSPLTTLFYSRHMFGKANPQLEALAGRPYDLVVLCEPDFPFVQDGTRQPASFRLAQHDWYRSALAAREIDYLTVGGDIGQRITSIERRLSVLPEFRACAGG